MYVKSQPLSILGIRPQTRSHIYQYSIWHLAFREHLKVSQYFEIKGVTQSERVIHNISIRFTMCGIPQASVTL